MARFTEYNKAWVALIMAILVVLDQVFGISFGDVLSEEFITMLLAVLTPILVWLIPNNT
jgi:purine-cytosine permease-like protein